MIATIPDLRGEAQFGNRLIESSEAQ